MIATGLAARRVRTRTAVAPAPAMQRKAIALALVAVLSVALRARLRLTGLLPPVMKEGSRSMSPLLSAAGAPACGGRATCGCGWSRCGKGCALGGR